MKCSKCQSSVKGQSIQTGAVKPEAVSHRLADSGYFCNSCQKGFCSKCSFAAAKEVGNGGYTCPDCHSLIGDYPWE